MRMFHVSSSKNRESILAYGLDWTRMAQSSGIAGSRAPEQEGCFLCEGEEEADWFVRMNNTGGPVDVWAVDGVNEAELVESPEGYFYVPRTVTPERLTLVRADIPPDTDRLSHSSNTGVAEGDDSGPIGTMLFQIHPKEPGS